MNKFESGTPYPDAPRHEAGAKLEESTLMESARAYSKQAELRFQKDGDVLKLSQGLKTERDMLVNALQQEADRPERDHEEYMARLQARMAEIDQDPHVMRMVAHEADQSNQEVSK